MILGHLIPAGTGFNTFQSSEVRVRPQALESLRMDRESVLTRQFPLLESGPLGDGTAALSEAGDVATVDGDAESPDGL